MEANRLAKRRLTMNAKMGFTLGILFVAGFAVLICRLVKLQIVDGSYYASKEMKQQLSTTVISPVRGTIYDRNMVPLAQSATVWDVMASPSSITSEAMRNSIADNLSKILSLDRPTVYNMLKKNTSYQVITKKIEKPVADAMSKYINDKKIGCLWLADDSKRYYPNGDFASQLLGFTGTDNQGLNGIEAQYDSVLKGVSGREVSAKTAKGNNIPYSYSEYIAAQNGSNLVLTIDQVVQHYLENALSKAVKDNNVANKATGIVMNVKTGEILAMSTEPAYNPNTPFTITDTTAKAKLAALSGAALTAATNDALQAQWQNKAISTPYEPGSVFKVVTTAGALEEGTLHETDLFQDPGSVKIADKTFGDWEIVNHNTVSFKEAFEQSLNVVFIRVGLNLGAQKFFNYYSDFGFTKKTGIDLPGEASGIYTSEKELESDVSLASCSFGQSNKVTAIQLITALAASANGGYLVTPHVVKEMTDQNGNITKTIGTTVKRQVISAETSKRIDALLEDEVNEGSGKPAYVAGYRIGGKTGTAEKLDPENENRNVVVASFGGIAPCDDPEIAVLIMLDEPHAANNYGGVIATPVAGTLFSEILPYLGVVRK
jgi:stage V sporulation protein D (sporulation-specific penicillin-binding protein)